MYSNLSREEVLKLHSYALKKHKEGFGQRRIKKMMQETFGKEISESTISSWIHKNKIPFGNELTRFKPLPIPSKLELKKLYIKEYNSAQEIAKKFNVSPIIVINWLKRYSIPVRTHKDAMNTSVMRNILRNLKLKKPSKDYSILSPEKAYLIGVLCGDGHINKKFIRFEIRRDEEFIKEFQDDLKKVYGIKFNYKYYAKRDSFVLYASNETICDDFLKYCKFSTFNWNIPKKVINSGNEKIISAFLRGIYDSEGHSTKYCVSFSSANGYGTTQIKKLLERLGISSKLSKYREKYFVLNITNRKNIKTFHKKVGFTIKRKQWKYD